MQNLIATKQSANLIIPSHHFAKEFIKQYTTSKTKFMRTIKPYTLITGASDGFGKALAIECARKKMNLALVALPGPELSNLACFIRRNFFVDVVVFEKDL